MKMMDRIYQFFDIYRLLVFAILKWQLIFYLPAFNIYSLYKFVIHKDAG
jgi:hypothetical protein